MSRNQLKLDKMWSNRKVPSVSASRSQSNDNFEVVPLPESESPSEESATIASEQVASESENSVATANGNLNHEPSSLAPDHEYISSSSCPIGCVQEVLSSKRSGRRTQYLPAWEKRAEAQYKTYVFDGFGARHEHLACWLYFHEDSMKCRLCEKYGKRKNSNGKMDY